MVLKNSYLKEKRYWYSLPHGVNALTRLRDYCYRFFLGPVDCTLRGLNKGPGHGLRTF